MVLAAIYIIIQVNLNCIYVKKISERALKKFNAFVNVAIFFLQ